MFVRELEREWSLVLRAAACALHGRLYRWLLAVDSRRLVAAVLYCRRGRGRALQGGCSAPRCGRAGSKHLSLREKNRFGADVGRQARRGEGTCCAGALQAHQASIAREAPGGAGEWEDEHDRQGDQRLQDDAGVTMARRWETRSAI